MAQDSEPTHPERAAPDAAAPDGMRRERAAPTSEMRDLAPTDRAGQADPRPLSFSPWQLAGALLIAAASDVAGGLIDSTIAGVPASIPLDIITALALWTVLGRPVLLLVALVAEALPGVGVLPVWTAVVIAIAVTGRIPGRIQ